MPGLGFRYVGSDRLPMRLSEFDVERYFALTDSDVSSLDYSMQRDELTLRAVAALTDGEYFEAGTASDLKQVYRQLSDRFALERRETDISALLAAASVLLLVAACRLSPLWFRR